MFSSVDEAARHLSAGKINLLGLLVPYPPATWARAAPERLRNFHLHYGDEVLGSARQGEEACLDAAEAGLEHWIAANPPGKGDGWHPYALSTRIGNWIAALSLEPRLASTRISDSLWRQLTYLQRNIENDILGNHLIRNARALVLGGLAFAEDELVARGLALLERELPEQVLIDGGHYERSPVYHAIVLRDLVEIQVATGVSHLDPVIDRMRTFAACVARPDGLPAPFNDSPLNLAPDLKAILPPPPRGLSVFRKSGYAVLRDSRQLWLSFDCGPAAPQFLPPHAHADGLSFQLWLNGKPFVVDPGTLTYEPGPDRDWCRGTPAHATVAVDGQSQFEFWGAFRASRLPTVRLMEASGCEETGALVAELEGFPRVSGGIRHRRRLAWSAQSIRVEDRLDGHGRHHVETVLPLAPGVSVEQGAVISADGVTIEPDGPLSSSVEVRSVSEFLFERVGAPAVVMRGDVTLPASFGWKISRLSRDKGFE